MYNENLSADSGLREKRANEEKSALSPESNYRFVTALSITRASLITSATIDRTKAKLLTYPTIHYDGCGALLRAIVMRRHKAFVDQAKMSDDASECCMHVTNHIV